MGGNNNSDSDITTIEDFSDVNLTNIVTPINVECYSELLHRTGYCKEKSKFLVQGFQKGFDIGYRGPTEWKHTSNNIPFSTGVGNKFDMWSKIMKEVKLG